MSQAMIKPIVAHYNNAFFVKSETSIYHYLIHLRQFLPICLAWKLGNADQFPFPRNNLYALGMQGGTMKRYMEGMFKHLLNRNLYFERIIKERGVRLIHAHFGHHGVHALHLKRKLSLPLVTNFYGSDLSRYDIVRSFRQQYNQLFLQGDMFLASGAFMKEKLHSLGCPLKKIQIQPIAIPVDAIPFRARKPKAGSTVKLLFCGHLTEKKGLLYALEAVKQVRQQKRNISFCIIGEGRLKDDILDYIQQHNLAECVELTGFLTYNEYLRRLADADIFIHPSITASNGDSEVGVPSTILEAQAMGLPVITTYHADIPNCVVPNRSALLSSEKNVEGLTQNIIFLLENQHLWNQMGKTGRDFVETYHDIKKETPKLEEKYKSLV
jgi:colanic acid/amylovoran/stewartan biosynthesis glycosyltransferase WcaL/AmsK/CpsK